MLYKRSKNIVKYSFVVAIVALVFFSSCQDAIDIGPDDEITESNAIENLQDLESALTGVYASMGGSTNVYWNSLFTDELRLPPSNNGQGIQVHTWSINSGDGTASGLYGSYSTLINRANRTLEAIPNISYAPSEQEAVDNVEGQLLAIRAWAHFKLMCYFAESYTDDSALGVP